MKIAYVTTKDPTDIGSWSGLITYILAALHQPGVEIETTGNIPSKDPIAFLKGVLYGRVIQRIYLKELEPGVLAKQAALITKRLAAMEYDLIFSPRSFHIAQLSSKKPIVFWHDSTFAGIMDFYVNSQEVSKETLRNGHRAEQSVLANCRLALYSSDWAASTALNHYDVDPAKVKVVPFGANIDSHRSAQDIFTILSTKNWDTCRLLFIGKEWHRKGGDIAVKITEVLNRQGIPAELHVVGCTPPIESPSFVKQHGYISKATLEGKHRLENLFAQSHFFLLPSRADCTPVVFPEACSFGLPVITSNVGGIPTIIREGKNGFAISPDQGVAPYCDVIQRYWSDRQAYERLAASSYQEYSERLNWTISGQKVISLIHESCE
jgi:glycosyltransferase involved in cell wall biosynthesis